MYNLVSLFHLSHAKSNETNNTDIRQCWKFYINCAQLSGKYAGKAERLVQKTKVYYQPKPYFSSYRDIFILLANQQKIRKVRKARRELLTHCCGHYVLAFTCSQTHLGLARLEPISASITVDLKLSWTVKIPFLQSKRTYPPAKCFPWWIMSCEFSCQWIITAP